jgi:hypothetical protein
VRALQRGLQPVHGARVGAGDDEQVGVAARVHRRAHLAHHLARVHHGLAGEVAAALGAGLVLQLHGVGAGALQRAHGVRHVDRIAEAGVGIHDQRQPHRVAQRRGGLRHLGKADEAEVRQAVELVGEARAAQVDGLEAELLDDARGQRVAGARHEQAAAGLEGLAQARAVGGQ